MVTTLALALAAAQPGGDVIHVPVCALVTPRGDNVGFFIWSEGDGSEVRLTSTEASVWPTRTVVARRPGSSDGIQFLLGGNNGLILELGRSGARGRRSATLFRSDGERASYPVAYGGCQDAPPPREPSPPRGNALEVDADNAAFNPTSWPDEDCALLLSDGRRIRFDPEIQQRSGEMRLTSPELWSGGGANVRVRWSNVNGVQVGQFGTAGTPGAQGVRVMMVSGVRAAALYRFADVGDPAHAGVSAYGMCGHRQVIRGRSR